MIELTGKMVEVGTAETVYSGRLVEVNEYEVHLESESGWVVIPVERVAYIREKEEEV
jgi:hypothetical protein